MRRRRFSPETQDAQTPKRAAIYCRVSTPQQRGKPDEDDKLSLLDQEVGCRTLCQAKGYVVNEKYVVREVSSGDNVHRPLLEMIFTAAKRGEIDLLVMYRINRLGRNDDKATYLYGRAVYEQQMQIEFVEAPPNEKLARFHMKFQTIFAEEYRDEVMRLTLEKKRERVTRRGLLLPGSWPLFGYTWDHEVKKGRYVIDEEAAAIVRRLFALAASGMSLNAICRLLNAEGVPTPSVYQQAHGRWPEGRAVGQFWREGHISRMLHTPAYWGEHAAFRHEHRDVVEQDHATGSYQSFHVIRLRPPGDETVVPLSPDICPPLIEKWQMEAAYQRMAPNKSEVGKYGGTREVALLRGGYVLCGYCGRPMYCRNAARSRMTQYYCRSIREKNEGRPGGCPSYGFYVAHLPLDQAVWQDIVSYFSDPDWLERILTREREREATEAGTRNNRLTKLADALAKKEAEADHLVQLAVHITSVDMRNKLQNQVNVVGTEWDVLKQEYNALLVPPESEEQRYAQQQAVRRWAEDAIVGLEHASIDQKRQALYWLGVEVRVWRSPGEPNFELVLTWRGLNAGKPLVLHEKNIVPSVSIDG